MTSPKPLTAKQEAFCQAIVAGMTQADAYRKVYKSTAKAETVHQSASRLMADPKVSARVADLRKPAEQAAAITLEGHLRDLADLRDKAARDGKWGPAVAAEIGRAKAAGYHVTRVEDITDPIKKAIGNLPPDKAQEMMDALDQLAVIKERSKRAAA